MAADPVVLFMAMLSLLLGLGSFAWQMWCSQDGGNERLHTISWLLLALFPVILLFSFFPQSEFSAGFMGATMTGAAGLFVFIWWYGPRAMRTAGRLDEEKKANAALRKRLDTEEKIRRPRQIAETRTYDYTVAGHPERKIVLITGDLRNVKDVDVWVNSENTDMQMSRFHERSISAVIRYEGARRDPLTERVTEDCVADELGAQVRANVPVEPGTAIVTAPHQLAGRNGVMGIVHAAVVHGTAGAGYRQVDNLGACVRNVFLRAEQIEDGGRRAASIVFPIFGTGEAGAEIEPTVRSMLAAILAHLGDNSPQRIETVYLLAYTDAELAVCEKAFDECDRIRLRTKNKAVSSGGRDS
jgi:O-acetyl-ADP-ribose deacetylase (regulator of RNase III)